MKGKTDYTALYRDHGLPLAEAYYLAEFNYFITKDPAVYETVQALRNEICRVNNRAPYSDEDTIDYCRRYMEKQGYSEEFSLATAAPMGLRWVLSIAGVALGFASLHPCLSPGSS